MRATARPVCRAFVEAMTVYGVPEEVLTDNGTVFTGRFIKPRPAEVLFERICRENGITQRLTRPRSPTTTGKIERLHQSLQRELLDVHGPFASLEALQAALDAWRRGVQHRPAAPVTGHGLPRLPVRPGDVAAAAAGAGRSSPQPASRSSLSRTSRHRRTCPRRLSRSVRRIAGGGGGRPGGAAVGQLVDRRAAGLARPAAVAGRKVTVWVDETSLHVLPTAPGSRRCRPGSGVAELARLAAAAPARPVRRRCPPGPARPWRWSARSTPPAWSAWQAPRSTSGYQLAGQRVTLRMDGTQMMVITGDGELARTMPCPVPAGRPVPAARRPPRPRPSRPRPSGPVTVQRRVSSRGGIMVATQKIQVGLIHAGKIVTVTAGDHAFRLIIDGQVAGVVPRTTTSEIHRYKAYAAHPRPGRR